MRETTAAEAAEAALAYLQRPQLVWIEDGYFVFRDGSLGDFRYDFRAANATEALHWVAHMAAKTWVTTAHLEVFALLACRRFGGQAG